ncbi:MAG: hypothetical protein IKU93_07020 [Alistipes sp.]|nr:hypothetical protein [Alistipes sp.]
MKNLFVIVGLALALVSCGPSREEYYSLLDEKNKLEANVINLNLEITHLKETLANYETSPDRIYVEAVELIKNKDIDGVSAVCAKLEKYHPASAECQKAKSELQRLKDEKEAQIKAEKAKRLQAVSKLKKEYDDVSGTTWYYNRHFTHYNNKNLTSLYIGKKGETVWLRLKMSYEGEDWIFFENAFLSYDGNTKTIVFDRYRDKESDNGYGGRVWEWIDVSVNDELLAFIKDMVNGKSLKMRLSGKYTETRVLSYDEKVALKEVLLAYDVLKNGE